MRISRRRLLAAAPLAVAAAALPGCAAAADDDDADDHPVGLLGGTDLWDIPDAAWRRALGSHPPGATGTVSPFGTTARPHSRTKRGIPVGGIGTGAFMLNLAGSFGPWHLDIGGDDSVGSRWGSPANSGFEDRYLSQAAFHVFTSTGVGTSVLRSPPRTSCRPGRCSTLAPGCTRRCSPRRGSSTSSCRCPWRSSSSPRSWRATSAARRCPVGCSNWRSRIPPTPPSTWRACSASPTPRTGCPPPSTSTRARDCGRRWSKAPGTVGVRLQAEDAENVPETQRTEWVIAARGTERLPRHRHRGLGRRRRRVRPPGRLQLGAPARPAPRPASPGTGRRGVRVVLAGARGRSGPPPSRWHGTSPWCSSATRSTGRIWRKRYTQWYPGSYQGWAIARDLLDDAVEARARHRRVVVGGGERPRPIPLWLRGAALNELYYDVFGGVFWENGCITKPKLFGARPGQHLYFTLETDVFRDCESMDVRHYEAAPPARAVPHHRARRAAGLGRHGERRSPRSHPARRRLARRRSLVRRQPVLRHPARGAARARRLARPPLPSSSSRPMRTGPTPATTPSAPRSIRPCAGP